MRATATALVVFGLAAAPAAQAMCAAPTDGTFGAAKEADVIIVATARKDSRYSPMTFDVDRYEKGSGPSTVKVTTDTVLNADGSMLQIEDRISPAGGDRWRIYGHRDDGVLEASICDGSHALGAVAPIPPRVIGARMLPSTWLGIPRRTLATATPAQVHTLRVRRGVLDLWLLRGHRRIARGSEHHGTWRLPTTAHPRHGDHLVADTGSAFYALTVR